MKLYLLIFANINDDDDTTLMNVMMINCFTVWLTEDLILTRNIVKSSDQLKS